MQRPAGGGACKLHPYARYTTTVRPSGRYAVTPLRSASEIGLGRNAQIGAYSLVALGELLLDDFFVLQAGDDDDVVAMFPVHRCGNAVVVGELQRIDHPKNLVEVAPRAGRVREDHADLLGRVDHEHRAHRGGGTGVGVNHVVERRHLAVGIGQNREIHLGVLGVVDVLHPFLVRVVVVDRNRNDLDVALGELARNDGRVAQLGGAHRREVGRVREQYTPAVAKVFVETNATLGGILFEIGSRVSQAQSSHVIPLKVD